MRIKIDQKSLDLKFGKKKKPYTLTIGNGLVWFERVQSEPFTIFETCTKPNHKTIKQNH